MASDPRTLAAWLPIVWDAVPADGAIEVCKLSRSVTARGGLGTFSEFCISEALDGTISGALIDADHERIGTGKDAPSIRALLDAWRVFVAGEAKS